MIQKTITELLLLFIFPIVFASFLPLETSSLVIIPFAVIILLRLLFLYQTSDITLKNIWSKQSLRYGIYYLIFTACSLVFLYAFRNTLELPKWLIDKEPIIFLLLHTLLQEIIFRVYLLNRLQIFKWSLLLTSLVSAGLFSAAHLVLPFDLQIISFTFISGFVWSYLYLKGPNLILVWLSHFFIDFGLMLFF